MNIECYSKYCAKGYDKCDISKNEWKRIFVGNSSIDRKVIFTNEYTKQDDYIVEYLGIESKDKPKGCQNNQYIMKMSKHYIDARNLGSLARYTNHSDEPNAKFIKICSRIRKMCFFAIRDIPAEKEITCDYGYYSSRSMY